MKNIIQSKIPYKHIAVFGMSFSGSTVFNYCLGAMPGTATINESHWLVDEHPSGVQVECSLCGSKCTVLSKELRIKLKDLKTGHYDILRDTLDCNVIISSDKELHIYDKLSPLKDYFPILLYKDPIFQTLSWLKATGEESSPSSINKYLDYWVRKNNDYLNRIKELGRGIALEITDFQENPEKILRQVCKICNIEYSSNWNNYWELQSHTIGGNYSPYTLAANGEFEKLRVSPRRPKEVPIHIKDIVESHENSHKTLKELRLMFQEFFPSV